MSNIAGADKLPSLKNFRARDRIHRRFIAIQNKVGANYGDAKEAIPTSLELRSCQKIPARLKTRFIAELVLFRDIGY
jgi:hypothetical protein